VLFQASIDTLRERLERDGFVVYPRLLGGEEAACFLDGLDACPDIAYDEILAHPAVASLAADSRLYAMVRDLLGPDVAPFRATLFGDPAGPAMASGWHQDVALPMTSIREAPGWGPYLVRAGIVHAKASAGALGEVLSLRLRLRTFARDYSLDHVALRTIPGTHLLGVLDDTEIARLAAERPATICEIPVGGALAMKPLLIHAGSESASPASAPVLAIDYATPALIAQGLALQ